MPNQEKSTIVSIISSTLVYIVYCIYVIQKYRMGELDPAGDFRFWGTVILVFIPIQIVANIVITIIFSIANSIITREEYDPSVTDERDKIIDLKSNNISYMVVGIGFLLSMVTLVIGYSPFVMFNLVYFSFFIADVIGNFVKLHFYRRGF